METLTVTAEQVVPAARRVMRERTRWLHKVANALEPEFKKRGFCYPGRTSVEARLPDTLAELFGNGYVSGETQSLPRLSWRSEAYNIIASHRFDDIERVRAILSEWMQKEHPSIDDYEAEVRIRANIPHALFAAGTLCHELCHAVMPPNEGHGPQWSALARSMGLDGSDEGLNQNGGKPGYLSSSNTGVGFTKLIRPILANIEPWPEAPEGFDPPMEAYFQFAGVTPMMLAALSAAL